MGRTVPSNPVIPPTQKRDARAKRARQTVNKDIPALLAAHLRARKGVEGAEVFGKGGPEAHVLTKKGPMREGDNDGNANKDVANSGHSQSIGKGRKRSVVERRRQGSMNVDEGDDTQNPVPGVNTAALTTTAYSRSTHISGGVALTHKQPQSSITSPRRPHIRIRVMDTLDAAHDLLSSLSESPRSKSQSHQQPHVTILNMCSPLRPGGGFLTGATSQEESLCMRTTLYPALREEFYRLPEVGGVYTPDILVFRGSDTNATDLSKNERWWCDVVSAGMLRFPDVEVYEDEETRYVNVKDRELVEEKMRGVMRIVHAKSKAKKKSGRGLILGAWGCGAYGNPVSEIAECWRKILIGDVDDGESSKRMKNVKAARDTEEFDKEREIWSDMEIVFAIKERKLATQFAQYFGGNVEVEIDDDRESDEEDSQQHEIENSDAELRDKIAELTSRIATSRSEMQRTMLTKMLEKLKLNEGDDD